MPRFNAVVKHVNILTRDIARSTAFYTDFLGFEYVKNIGPQKVVLDAGGFDFFIQEVERFEVHPDFHIGLKVDHDAIFEFAKALDEAGIPLVKGNNPEPIVYSMPGTDRTAAYFQDPDGWIIELYTAA